jgi:DNA replication protein DnaC
MRDDKFTCLVGNPHCELGFVRTMRNGYEGLEPCACRDARIQQSIIENANIPYDYQNCSFDTFLANDSAQRAHLVLAKKYVRDFPISPTEGLPGLMLIGPTGTGKTFLAVAILNGLLARGFDGVFMGWLNFLEHVKSTYDRTRPGEQFDYEAKHIARDATVLVLDDLGASKYSEHDEQLVTTLLTERCNQRRATIVTTNVKDVALSGLVDPALAWNRMINSDQYAKRTLEEMIGVRSRSRLFQMCKVVQMEGQDYRTIIAKEGRKPRPMEPRP